MSQPVRSCSIRRVLAFCALSSAEMSYYQIPEMFAAAKGNPELININILHLRNCENHNICINGSDHDFPISTLRNNVHVQHDQIRTSASSLAHCLPACHLFLVSINDLKIFHQTWCPAESSKSSTWRELRTADLALSAFALELQG